jgi:tRNA(Ile)-lysidine synthase
MTLYEEFLSYKKDNNLFGNDDRVMLAVSGGIDSMVMSHLFLKLGTNIGIAHCNFSLRGRESDLDEEFVRNFSDNNGTPFYTIRFSTKEYSADKGISVQMAARELRYSWFEKIREDNNYDFIAVAHNRNDNVETLLINLIRGTGITGLSGMKPASNRIIRPILFASRNKLEEYCNENRILFREDKSNAETRYTRNKIRHQILPLLKEINPSVEETLNETAGKLAGLDKIVTDFINGLRVKLSVKRDDNIIFDIEKLLKLKAGKALIFELFGPYGITGATSGDLVNIIAGSTGKQVFTKTHRMVINRNELIVSPLEIQKKDFYKINTHEDLLMVPGIMAERIIANNSGFKIPDSKNIASVDFDKIRFPLLVRPWESGDIFLPFGMKKKKKLSNYFIDRKYSLVDKEKALILESEDNIVWIIGERIDDRFKVTRLTSTILQIEATKISGIS